MSLPEVVSSDESLYPLRSQLALNASFVQTVQLPLFACGFVIGTLTRQD
jgi:hypothetical protein